MPPTDPDPDRAPGPDPLARHRHRPTYTGADATASPAAGPAAGEEDTVDLDLDPEPDPLLMAADQAEWDPADPLAPVGRTGAPPFPGGSAAGRWRAPVDRAGGRAADRADLLDGLPGWGSVRTDRGAFQLVPVVPARDLPLLARWMNDPAVAAFWGLAGPPETTDRHLRAQLRGDGRSTPCLGVLDGRPVSYWEVYRADLDPLARYYPARPHDTGVHLLVGRVADRGRGLGGTLLRAVADHILDRRPACARVVAEPDLRNTASVAAFLTAGFRFAAELDLPGKRAALMVRERRWRPFL